MIRNNKDDWQRYITQWKDSGLSPHKFCKNNGLIQSTFMRWVDKLETKRIPIKVELPVNKDITQEIIIEGNGLRIILPSTIDCSLLSATIREVGRCS